MATNSGGSVGGITPSKSSAKISAGSQNPAGSSLLNTEEAVVASATTAAEQIANVVARLIEPFISLCHCRVENKKGAIRWQTRRVAAEANVAASGAGGESGGTLVRE